MDRLTTQSRGPRVLIFWVVVGVVVILDQATKAAVRFVSPQTGRIGTLVPGLLDLCHVENTGAAFSIGEGAGSLFALLAAFFAVAGFLYVYREELPLGLTVSISSVVGGGIGNMIDRVVNGSVTDFIATTFVDFPVFNVADIAVTCGIAVSVVFYLRWERRLAQAGE